MSQRDPDWFAQPRFASQLDARVVDERGAEPRIHGFGVRSDLVQHFSFADVVFLALTAKEPTERTSSALRRALILLAPVGAGSAPAHLGTLAHLVSRDHSTSIASATAVLAARAANCIAERAALLQSLGEERPPPPDWRVPDAESADPSLPASFSEWSELAKQPWFSTLDALSAAIAVLFECGLEESWQLESMLFIAWCPCVLGEMGPRGRDSLESYPINVPRFRYVQG